MMRRIVLGVLVALMLAPRAFAAPIIPASGKDCRFGIHEQPNGPFAVMLFCEDVLGSQLAVIYYKTRETPKYLGWALAHRFWQSGEWGTYVTGFAWDDTGQYLLVSSSAIHCSGAVYLLDLRERTSRQLFPGKLHNQPMKRIADVCATVIRGVHSQERRVDVAALGCDGKTEVTASLSY